MYDVIVVGAGPSGLNAANKMAEGGLDVLVLEGKGDFGNHVICNGILGQEAFKKFELSKNSILKEIKKIKVISPFGTSLSYEHSHPFAFVVDRSKFDKYLANRARARGAKIKLWSKAEDISVNRNHVEVLIKRGDRYHKKFYAKVAIIATGINFQLHKKLGLGYPRKFLKGAQTELKIGKVNNVSAYVGNQIASGAFAWSVPIGGMTARIGLMTEKDPKACFSHLMEKIFPEGNRELDETMVQYKPIAQGLISGTYRERVLSVGEAAGQVKTTTGGGIYFGLLCSEIAGQVVLQRIKEGRLTCSVFSEYERLWQNAIQKEIITGYYARKICSKLNDKQIEKMFQIAQNDGVIPLIRKKGNFDWHGNLILALLKKMPILGLLNK